jgi:NADH dehydrogenase FAD-containing subunit
MEGNMMRKILILGAGAGGTIVANMLRKELELDDDPQIVELVKRLPQIRRKTILNSTKHCPQEAPHAARKL